MIKNKESLIQEFKKQIKLYNLEDDDMFTEIMNFKPENTKLTYYQKLFGKILKRVSESGDTISYYEFTHVSNGYGGNPTVYCNRTTISYKGGWLHINKEPHHLLATPTDGRFDLYNEISKDEYYKEIDVINTYVKEGKEMIECLANINN